eukprot:5891973-Prymnesium_polylepis.1
MTAMCAAGGRPDATSGSWSSDESRIGTPRDSGRERTSSSIEAMKPHAEPSATAWCPCTRSATAARRLATMRAEL